MSVDAVNFRDDEVEEKHVTDDGRNVSGLGDADHQRLNPRQRLMVDENGMSRFQPHTCIVVHVNRNARHGQVFLRGKENVDLNVSRHGGVQPVDEEFQILTFKAVGDDGHLRVHRLPLRHLEVHFVGGNACEHTEIIHQLDRTRWKRR